MVILTIIGVVAYQQIALNNVKAAGNITGTVFQDFNANGIYDTSGGTTANPTAVDVVVAGVTVTAYDSTGAPRGSAVTNASGAYTLAATGTGPYRIEFTTLPIGFQPSARSVDSITGNNADQAGSAVQFVADGNTANINLAVSRARDYCQNNPEICATTYSFGTQNDPAIFTVPFNAGSTRTTGGRLDPNGVNDFANGTRTQYSTSAQTGTTYGLAYSRATRKIFASAFMKKHSAFGPAGTGAIYQIDRSSGNAVSVYADLNQIFGANTAGANPHNPADYNTDNGNATWDAVGKIAFGGLAISDDQTKLYTMNLANRTLYEIPATGTVSAATIRTSAFPTALPNCANADDVRPFAVNFHDNQIYVGAVCSATATDSAANLYAYVYRVNPTDLTFSAQPVFQAPLNYTRTQTDTGVSALWRAWRTTYTTIGTGLFIYPQPWLTDIAFDNGNLILALRDRNGDQTGYVSASNPNDPNELFKGITAGDTLRACGSPTTGWTLEANAQCGGITTAGANTSEGSAGGEYYYQDNYHPNNIPHAEVSVGGVLQLPGYQDVMATMFNPVYVPDDSIFDAGGFRWMRNSTGAQNRGYLVYDANSGDFGKANGVGGTLPALCDAAPIEIGNRIWRDLNGNGVQDPQESNAAAGYASLAGVTVRLYNAANVLIATAFTDVNGEYYFVGGTGADPNVGDNIGVVSGGIVPSSNYQIRFDNPADYAAGGVLSGSVLTLRDSAFQAGNQDASDSDAVNAVNPVGSPSGGTFPVIAVTTGASGANNHTFDAGFASAATLYSVGNRVWFDADNNGRLDAAEQPAANTAVGIFLGSATTATQTAATDASGYYRFDGLAAGSYRVCVINSAFQTGGVLFGSQNTAGADAGNLDSTVLNSENGINPAVANAPQSGGLCANPITLGPGANQPTGEADLAAGGQGTVDNQANMTVDFGFYRLCLTGTVWRDLNNNGLLGAGEIGLPNLFVRIYAPDGTTEINVGNDGILGTLDDGPGGVRTNSAGNYSFCGLAAGNYIVKITGGGLSSSTPTFDPQTNVDSDDNGANGTGADAQRLVSGLITLTPGSLGAANNNTIVYATGQTTNPTLDFGVSNVATAAPANLGGRVTTSAGKGIAKARVTLYEANGSQRTALTSTMGYYRFENVSAGQTVVLEPSAKGYAFANAPRALEVNSDATNIDFAAGGNASKTPEVFEPTINKK